MTTLSRMRSQISSTQTFPNGLIVTSGNVGIGTGSPGALLHVTGAASQSGTFRISSNGQSTNNFDFGQGYGTGTDNIAWILNRANASLVVGTNNTEYMRITSSGNVGIGTSSPGNLLTLGGTEFAGIAFQSPTYPSNGTYVGLDGIGNFAINNRENKAITISTNYTERMRITSAGNVGIGTSSPGSLLEVYSTSTTTPYVAARLYSEAAVSGESFTWAKIEKGNGYGGAIGGYISQGIGSGLVLGTLNGSATITERMRITHTGNVGIGTTSPGFPLHISSSTSQNLANFNYSTAGGYSEIQVSSNDRSIILGQRSSTAPAGDLAYLYTPNATPFAIYNSAAERLRINADGNIGIGGIAGTFYKLEVSGRGLFSHSTSSCELLVTSSANNAYFIVNGFTGYGSYVIFRKNGADKWYLFNEPTMDRMYLIDQNSNDGVYISQNTTSWTSNSDLRLKDVQGTITNALDKVQQLTGVKFTWKRDADNPEAKVRVGLIAQDVQAVLPEAVDDESPDLITDEETGRVSGGLGVRYTELVPLLVNAIKELKAEVNELRAQVQGA